MKSKPFLQIAPTAALLLLGMQAFALGADFKYPLSAAVTPDGAIYIADRNLPGIWKVVDGKAAVYFQASKKFRTPLNAVRCLAVDSKGRLLAGDSATREVYRFEKDGKPKPLTKGFIGIPMCIAADGKGMLYVGDVETQRIWKVSEDGGQPKEFAIVTGPRGLAFDKDGKLWAVSFGKNQLLRFSSDGKSEPVVKGRAFRFPHNVVVGKDGTAYVTDGYGKCVWKIAAGKSPEKLVEGNGFVNPVGLSWRKENLLVVDPRANAVFEVTPAGKMSKLIGGPVTQK